MYTKLSLFSYWYFYNYNYDVFNKLQVYVFLKYYFKL